MGRQLRELTPRLVIEQFAHAVQALHLEVGLPADLDHRGQRVGVVGGELGEQGVRCAAELGGAGDVGEVRRRLAREHRILLESADLGALDLGVPIGALDEADHEAARCRPGEFRKPVQYGGGAF